MVSFDKTLAWSYTAEFSGLSAILVSEQAASAKKLQNKVNAMSSRFFSLDIAFLSKGF